VASTDPLPHAALAHHAKNRDVAVPQRGLELTLRGELRSLARGATVSGRWPAGGLRAADKTPGARVSPDDNPDAGGYFVASVLHIISRAGDIARLSLRSEPSPPGGHLPGIFCAGPLRDRCSATIISRGQAGLADALPFSCAEFMSSSELRRLWKTGQAAHAARHPPFAALLADIFREAPPAPRLALISPLPFPFSEPRGGR
jgi:hypothetical protein